MREEEPAINAFLTATVERITGLKGNTLHSYIQRGAIVPEVRDAEGRGSRRLFSARNLVEAFVLKWLMDLGLPRNAILAFFENARRGYGPDCFDPRTVQERSRVTILFYPSSRGETAFRILEGEAGEGGRLQVLDDGPGWIVINLSWIVTHLVLPRLHRS